MRVLFITEDDPLYVIHFFDVFLSEYPREEFEIAGITVGRAFDESRIATARRLLRFYGPLDVIRLLLRLVVAKGRRRSIEALARKESISLLATSSVNDPGYVDRIRRLDHMAVMSGPCGS